MSGVVFDHIALAVERLADAPGVLAGCLGGLPDFGADAHEFRFGQWQFAGGGRIEVLEPRGTDGGFVHRFLARRGPGIHHVTFKVPDLAAACDRARAHGYDIVGYDDSDPLWKEAFLHPNQALGIVVQFAQAGRTQPPHSSRPPAGPPNPPPPVTLVGLRLRARSIERARTQWQEVVGGESAEGPGGVKTYRWTGSPMRLAVEIDALRPEGAIAIEYASERPVDLGPGPHPVLGVTFSRVPRE